MHKKSKRGEADQFLRATRASHAPAGAACGSAWAAFLGRVTAPFDLKIYNFDLLLILYKPM